MDLGYDLRRIIQKLRLHQKNLFLFDEPYCFQNHSNSFRFTFLSTSILRLRDILLVFENIALNKWTPYWSINFFHIGHMPQNDPYRFQLMGAYL
jgi:hypothetical protein